MSAKLPARLFRRAAHACTPQASCVRRAALSFTPPDLLRPAWGGVSEPVGVYVHLPFCKRKCFYCDFPVVAVGMQDDRAGVQNQFESYVDVLCDEIRSQSRMNAHPLQTVYFGGGTPSLLPPHLLERIMTLLCDHLGVCEGAEVSMEADPGTFDAQRLQHFVSCGVNRFSVGVQAFDEALLQACGRAHSLRDVFNAVECMHTVAPQSWSLDLISGLPGLTMQQWEHNLESALAAEPHHISVYDLQVEEGTPFEKWRDKGRITLPEDDTAADMYAMASARLRSASFEHYEISNYARAGHRSQHNQVYWYGHSYYAFGLGASSFLGGARLTRPRKMGDWSRFVLKQRQQQRGAADDVCTRAPTARDVPAFSSAPLTAHDRMLECVMLQLRLTAGLDVPYFCDQFGRDNGARILHTLQRHAGAGLTRVDWRDAVAASARAPGLVPTWNVDDVSRVALTDPEGLLVSNGLIADCFEALS